MNLKFYLFAKFGLLNKFQNLIQLRKKFFLKEFQEYLNMDIQTLVGLDNC